VVTNYTITHFVGYTINHLNQLNYKGFLSFKNIFLDSATVMMTIIIILLLLIFKSSYIAYNYCCVINIT
jgi:hypothetical protein